MFQQNGFLILMSALIALACHPSRSGIPGADPSKIGFPLEQFDTEGLRGKDTGKTALDYEFCIPRQEKAWQTVAAIDPSARRQKTGRGRIGCTEHEWLVLGNTRQTHFKDVLLRLSAQPFIHRIEENVWE